MRRRSVRCSLAIFGCIDFRYVDAASRRIRKTFRVKQADVKTDAGGSWRLLHGEPALKKSFIQIARFMRDRHKVRRFAVWHHEDCAAYGGSTSFPDRQKERARHVSELRRARTILKRRVPGIKVSLFYFSRRNNRIICHRI